MEHLQLAVEGIEASEGNFSHQQTIDAILTLTRAGLLYWASNGEWLPADAPLRFNNDPLNLTVWVETQQLEINIGEATNYLPLSPRQIEAFKDVISAQSRWRRYEETKDADIRTNVSASDGTTELVF